MKNNYFKKLLLLAIIFLTFFSFAQKSSAQVATIDAANVAQSTISAAANTASAASSYSLQLKEFVLDNIAYMLAKVALREITSKTVNWINSGFNGNPAFISNPAEFFKDIGDQALGQLIEGSDLNFLCSPFSIDLRLALAFKYRPFQKRISCTLSDVIRNSTGAVQNASINGFTAGDFRQGGWPAFISMTTEPQNNIYGAYVEADYELSARVARNEALKKDELNQGRGFLSWKKCTGGDVAAPGDPSFIGPTQPNEGTQNIGSDTIGPEAPGSYRREPNCVVQTPGSVIAGVLDANTTGPLQDLHLADEINEVVNALFSQLVTKVLTGGLKGLSGKGASDPDAYITQLQEEQAQNNQQLQTIKDNILKNIDNYINKEIEFRGVKNETLEKYLKVKNKFDEAKSCFIKKLQDPNLRQDQISFANSELGSIELAIQTKLSEKSSNLLNDVSTADQNINDLKEIKRISIAAKNVNDISKSANDFSSLVSSQLLANDKDIMDAKTERDNSIIDTEPLYRQAFYESNLCSIFPNNYRRE